MFARTERLTLRPAWVEDAPELTRAIGHEAVVRNLSRAPWPYTLSDAESFLQALDPDRWKSLLIYDHVGGGVRLVGGIGIGTLGEEPHEIGYWVTPEAWGRGYATEAGRAVVRLARDSLRLTRLTAGHFTDNPASGRVLAKIGFRPTGQLTRMHSRGRDGYAPSERYTLDLSDEDTSTDRMAA